MPPTVPWPLVGNLDPAGLVDARLQVHHAAQLVVALGISLLRDGEAGVDPGRLTDARHYTFPEHPVGRGEPFHPDEAAAARPNASEVWCWPPAPTLPAENLPAGSATWCSRFSRNPLPHPRRSCDRSLA